MDFASAAAAVLSVAFGWAGLSKAFARRRWRASVDAYPYAAAIRSAATLTVPVAEIAVAGALMAGFWVVGGAAAAGMSVAFSLALLRLRSVTGDRLPCGCFGGTATRDYRFLLMRNALLAATAVFVATRPSAATSAELLSPGLVLAVVGVGIIGWVARSAITAMRRP